VNEEYNTNFTVNLPSGYHLITITNTGGDWFYLDWVQLNQVLPAAYSGNWQPSPDAIGLSGPRESLLYVVAPDVSFPANATTVTVPVQHAQTITLTNWPAGNFIADWYDPATAASLGLTQANTTNNNLVLSMPDFTEDLAAIVYSPPTLTALNFSSSNGFQFRLDSETGGQYLIQKSSDLLSWTSFLNVTNTDGAIILMDPSSETNSRSFFRAGKAD
jgi:hypothetical protein